MQPLTGIRVLEFGNFLAGPFCGMLLGDMGADVIKCEPIKGGDMTRITHPKLGGESANFLAVNRNKRSLAIDLKQPESKEIVYRLAMEADVVIENYRPGVLDRMGFGCEQLQKVNPSLVYTSVSGFGQTGPYRDRGAVNLIIEAAAGGLSVTGEPEGMPMRPGVQTGDMFGALFATYGVLCGLIGKLRHQASPVIDVSLVEASVAAAIWETSEYFATGQAPRRLGHRHRLTAPYQVFATSDGYVAIGCPNDRVFERLSEALGLGSLVADDRFVSYFGRKKNEAALLAIVEPVVADWIASDLELKLAQAGVPCSVVNDYQQVFDNPQSSARALEASVNHPAAGVVRTVRNPVLFNEGGPQISRPAPMLGEHTEEILSELKFSKDQVCDLLRAGVIGLSSAPLTKRATV